MDKYSVGILRAKESTDLTAKHIQSSMNARHSGSSGSGDFALQSVIDSPKNILAKGASTHYTFTLIYPKNDPEQRRLIHSFLAWIDYHTGTGSLEFTLTGQLLHVKISSDRVSNSQFQYINLSLAMLFGIESVPHRNLRTLIHHGCMSVTVAQCLTQRVLHDKIGMNWGQVQVILPNLYSGKSTGSLKNPACKKSLLRHIFTSSLGTDVGFPKLLGMSIFEESEFIVDSPFEKFLLGA